MQIALNPTKIGTLLERYDSCRVILGVGVRTPHIIESDDSLAALSEEVHCSFCTPLRISVHAYVYLSIHMSVCISPCVMHVRMRARTYLCM